MIDSLAKYNPICNTVVTGIPISTLNPNAKKYLPSSCISGISLLNALAIPYVPSVLETPHNNVLSPNAECFFPSSHGRTFSMHSSVLNPLAKDFIPRILKASSCKLSVIPPVDMLKTYTLPTCIDGNESPVFVDKCIRPGLTPHSEHAKMYLSEPVTTSSTFNSYNDGNCVATAVAENYDMSFPDIIDTSTPDISDISDLAEAELVATNISSRHEILETTNLLISGEEKNVFLLNPSAEPFQSSIDKMTCYSNEVSGDKESPYNILQNLRLKNVDRIIIGHININSVRNKIHLLADMISGKVDIMLISETKLDNTFPKVQFHLQGYSEPSRLDRTAHGGGLLLYVRSDIPIKPLPLVFGNIECIILEATISKKKWLLIGTYNPSKSLISKHLQTLEKSICHYLSLYDNVIVFGDLNSEIGEEAMDDFCHLYNLKSLIKVPTCYKSAENPSCIDLILTNRPHSFQNSTAFETGLSAFHLLTVTVLKTTFRKRPPKVVKYRDYKTYSYFQFHHDLDYSFAGVDLDQISNDAYFAVLVEVLDKHAPLKTKSIRANDQPFVTKQLRKEHMKRTRLRNKFKKNSSETNKRSYNLQRNLCVKLLKKTKTSYFENLKPSNISDNKNFWTTVKPMFSEKAASAESITLIENNKIVSVDQEVAEIFNSYFSNAVKSLNIENYEHFSFDEYFLCKEKENEDLIFRAIEKYKDHPSIQKIKENVPQNASFSFKSTDIKTVIKEIGNLDESKSTPIESIPAKILKDHFDIIGPKIAIDFNLSIKTGVFPQRLKLADISPIFKTGIKQHKLNYRPVSILSALSKIFEKLMLYQVDDYMRDKLSIYLCGFRKSISVQNCLLFLVERWKKSLDKYGKCGVLLTDLSKAFDCLVHDLFIAKLHAYGFDYPSLKLIHSYLTDRKQRIRINASFSAWSEITTGVPQGSVLGPNLYNINSNDLFLFLLLDIANYADDNSPFSVAPTIPQVLSELQAETQNLLNWIRNNGLKANPDKFHLLLSDPSKEHYMNIDNFVLQNSQYEKLLGVTIDSKFTFNEHVKGICTKASQKLHALSRVSNFMSLHQRKTVMKTFIVSHFGYCPLVWMLHSRKLNHRINRLHERALRIVYRDDISSFEDLLVKDESFTIHERNIQTLAIELYKVFYGLSSEIMKLIFPKNTEVRFPGKFDFKSFNVKTVWHGTETLGHLGPKIWSSVPQNIKTFSLSKFTQKIRKWKPNKCPCRICKVYVKQLGFVTISS